jgi:hypothetical protein
LRPAASISTRPVAVKADGDDLRRFDGDVDHDRKMVFAWRQGDGSPAHSPCARILLPLFTLCLSEFEQREMRWAE